MTGFGKKNYGCDICYSLRKKVAPSRSLKQTQKITERIIINSMATLTSANLPYPLPQCSLIVIADMNSDELRTFPFSFG